MLKRADIPDPKLHSLKYCAKCAIVFMMDWLYFATTLCAKNLNERRTLYAKLMAKLAEFDHLLWQPPVQPARHYGVVIMSTMTSQINCANADFIYSLHVFRQKWWINDVQWVKIIFFHEDALEMYVKYQQICTRIDVKWHLSLQFGANSIKYLMDMPWDGSEKCMMYWHRYIPCLPPTWYSLVNVPYTTSERLEGRSQLHIVKTATPVNTNMHVCSVTYML